ncbi:MAG: DUF5715 family protein [Niabella sp.]
MKLFRAVCLWLLLFLSCHINAQIRYDDHLKAARATGVPPLKNLAHIKALANKKKLVHVLPNRGYAIAKLTYSRPYLNPRAYNILKTIGSRFYTKSRKKTFMVTSITRTLYDQKRLSRVNSNAVTGKLSSHNYGCSFDLSYIRFNRRKGSNPNLEMILQGILTQLQAQRKLYFIKEYREKCFHITVR